MSPAFILYLGVVSCFQHVEYLNYYLHVKIVTW